MLKVPKNAPIIATGGAVRRLLNMYNK
jgi:hypothetical protein